MEPPDVQSLDEAFALTGRNHGQPIRLPVVGRELRQELVIGDAGRSREPRDGMDPAADFLRNPGRRAAPGRVRHVEIGFVERQGLDQRRVVGQDGSDLQRDAFVDVEPRFDEDELGAAAYRCHRRHRRAHTVAPGLVTSGRNHPPLARPADRHGFASQCRIVTLFDRCVERVHVHVDDLPPAPFVYRQGTVAHGMAPRQGVLGGGDDLRQASQGAGQNSKRNRLTHRLVEEKRGPSRHRGLDCCFHTFAGRTARRMMAHRRTLVHSLS